MLLSGGIVEQDFLCKGDDRGGRLSQLQLAEHVAMIVVRRCVLGDERKNVLVANGNFWVGDLNAPTMIVRIQSEVGDGVGRIMFAEEKLAWVVGQRDALCWDLEVNFRWRWQRSTIEQHSYGLANSLRSRQRFGVDAKQIQYIASGALRDELLLSWRLIFSHLNVALRQD